jgi:hypothetical protein
MLRDLTNVQIVVKRMITEAKINFYPADWIRKEHIEADFNPATIIPKEEINIEIKKGDEE